MSILIGILLGIWMLVAVLMMLVILMQRPKSEGLGAAFGGAVTENLFGAQTTNVLVKFTAWLAGIFFAITFTLSVLYAHRSMAGSSLTRELKKTAPAAVAVPSPVGAGKSSSPNAAQPIGTASGLVPAASASVPAASGSVPSGDASASPAGSVAPQTKLLASPAASQPPKP